VSYAIISALFLFSLGRELCGDVIDRRGDRPAFVHRIPSTTVALAALHIQIAAVVLLAITIKSLAGRLVLMIFTAILAVAWHRWLADAKHEMALQFMKYDLFLGLYFIMV
jgi:uncharacterized membrane protein YphA (DoxX/SURF4 family)